MRRELARSAKVLAARFDSGAPFARLRADQLPLELRRPAKDGQHQPRMCGRRVRLYVAAGWKTHLPLGDRGQLVQQTACRTCQPVEPRHQKHIPRLKLAERTAKLRPAGPRRPLLVPQPAAERLTRVGRGGAPPFNSSRSQCTLTRHPAGLQS